MSIKNHYKIICLLSVLFLSLFISAGRVTYAAPKSKTISKSALNKALFNAIWKSNLHEALALLARGADANAHNDLGQAPLGHALDMCDDPHILLPLIKALIAKKANVNAENVMSFAVDNGSLPALQLLIQHGANVNAWDSLGFTPLMEAAQKGRTAMTALLLQKGAKVNAQTKEGETALMLAAGNGNIEIARILLTAGANPNVHTTIGYPTMTPLDYAISASVSQDDTTLVRLLLDHGADPNFVNQHSPLVDAAALCERKNVELLLDHGAGNRASVLNEALIAALNPASAMMHIRMCLYPFGAKISDEQKAAARTKAEADGTAIVRALLDHGAEVSHSPDNAPLITAAIDGVAPIVRLLLDKGAPVNGSNSANTAADVAKMMAIVKTADDYVPQESDDSESPKAVAPSGITPLMAAAEEGHTDVCTMLLDAGADPNQQDTNGKTALMHLVENGRSKIDTNLMYSTGINVDEPIFSADTPAAIIRQWAEEGDAAIAQALLAKNADLEVRDKQGYTALMKAATDSSPGVVQVLAEAGADINTMNTAGHNALMQVILNGRLPRAQRFVRQSQSSLIAMKKLSDLYATKESHAEYAKIKSRTEKDNTEAIQTATAQDIAVIKVLLAASVDRNAKDKKGQTALQMAQATRHTDIINLLKQAK
jgi:ankyrin repeat protein